MSEHSGNTEEADRLRKLAQWEATVLDAVGRVIEFWGFKHNHGRIWALLYVRDEPLTAGELQDVLSLSKAAVSMLLREIENWGVVKRVKRPGRSGWCFEAEGDFMKMAGQVIARREAVIVNQVTDELEEAENLMPSDVDDDARARLQKMLALAQLFQHAVNALADHGTFDFQAAGDIFSS